MTTLFDVNEWSLDLSKWSSDDWETPHEIARKMAALVQRGENVIEPAAGRGAIVRELRHANVLAFEINERRTAEAFVHPHVEWVCIDFLREPALTNIADVVITNPPFSLALEFIEHSLKWLNPLNPQARLLYLLPGDVFASQTRCDRFEALDCHIHHRHRIRGRVAYIREGVQIEGRQVYDCVYDIRPGKRGATETVL